MQKPPKMSMPKGIPKSGKRKFRRRKFRFHICCECKKEIYVVHRTKTTRCSECIDKQAIQVSYNYRNSLLV